MKTKITLSALALLFACYTLNAFNFSNNSPSKTILTENVANEAYAPSVDLNGFIFEFLGVQYNTNGTSTWTYRVTGNGARRSLSHWKLKLLNEHNVTTSSPNTWEVHVDPHFRYYGIKWDSSVHKNGGTKTFSFTLNGIYDVGQVDFGYKAGRKLFHGTIPGPTTPAENTISGTVFNDTNMNGVQDGVEGFLSGVEVKLYEDTNANGTVDAGEALLDTKITDGVGGYIFNGTSAMNVVVQATLPTNTSDFTYQATTFLTTAISLTANDVTGVDFGIKRTQVLYYDISGVVYDDDNQNMMNDSEAGLAAVQVKMYHDANADGILDAGEALLATTTTDANGFYTFAQVNVTHVIIEVTTPRNANGFEYVATTDTQEAITMVNQNIIDVNFGINKIQIINYNIAGTVFDDDNANGLIDAGENTLENATLTLYADNDGNGRVGSGDTVIATTTSAADGTYNFANVTTENTVVAVTVPTNTADFTYALTTSGALNTSSTNTDVNGADFGINKVQIINYNISGTVYDDDNANGLIDAGEAWLENVTLTLYADNDNNGRIGSVDTVISTTTSAVDGTYGFANVTARNTIVTVSEPTDANGFRYTLTTADRRVTNSTTIDVTNVNFGINKETSSYDITGNVFNDVNSDGDNRGDSGLSGTEVRLYDDLNQNGRVDRGEPLIATANTDRDGNYAFAGITQTHVIVQVVVPASTAQFTYLATTQVNVPVSGGTTTVNFGINRSVVILYNITGIVWDDADADQMKDADENRLNGVAVTLFDDANANGIIDTADTAISTITTSETGTYAFNGVNLRNVIIKPTVPSNGVLTTPGERAISSVNTNIIDADFGIDIEDELYQVTGVVFDDDNENGIPDPGEGSIDGLDVQIYADTDASGTFDPSIDQLVAFTQTSNGGFGFTDPNYLVDDVPPGQVFVVIVIPPDNPPFESWTPTYDPDSGTANPDGVYPTFMNGSLSSVDFGINYVNLNSTARSANTTDVVFTDGTSFNEAPEDISERLHLYPNPTSSEISINAEEFEGAVTVEIYNDRGYQIISTTANKFGEEAKINVQRLAPGMYYAKFISKNKVANKKFIKK